MIARARRRWQVLLLVVGVIACAAFAALTLSPWPSALAIRFTFDIGGRAANAALAQHVPANVAARLDEYVGNAEPATSFDVYFPAEIEGTTRTLPTIVWIHGGGYVSGDKSQVANYLKILAGKGYTTIGVNYALSPRHAYPTALRQVNAALARIVGQAQRLHVDASRIVLAGDSAGAHMAAQLANIITAPDYARQVGIAPALEPTQLAGALLYCGPYDVGVARAGGTIGPFMATTFWSYSGTRNFAANAYFATASVVRHVTPRFPPTFISVGNGDPLLPQSLAFADALAGQGVKVDRLFFAEDHAPALPHEYQFKLDTEGGRLALQRSLAFLAAVTKR
jgi:acetyl esterase